MTIGDVLVSLKTTGGRVAGKLTSSLFTRPPKSLTSFSPTHISTRAKTAPLFLPNFHTRLLPVTGQSGMVSGNLSPLVWRWKKLSWILAEHWKWPSKTTVIYTQWCWESVNFVFFETGEYFSRKLPPVHLKVEARSFFFRGREWKCPDKKTRWNKTKTM